MGESYARRAIAARETAWARRIAAWLVARGVRPNAISIASIACAALAAAALGATSWQPGFGLECGLFLLAIVGIQARLLCNLFDGMVAIEGGKCGKAGEVYNDFPDRIADVLIFVAAGYAAGGAWGVTLGWTSAVLAVMTAYVRVLGRALGAGIYFIGPMAKQHRMATLSGACLIAAIGAFWDAERWVMFAALIAICAGTALTLARRTMRIVLYLERA